MENLELLEGPAGFFTLRSVVGRLYSVLMLVNQAFRFELDPNNAQRTLLAKHAGAARFTFNRGLEQIKLSLEAGKGIPSAMEQHREWNRFKRENATWWSEVSKCAPQEALRDLDKAMKGYFASKKKGSLRVGFPKFKRKGVKDSFRLTGSIRVGKKSVTLPRIGKVRTKEPTDKLLTSGARILSATVRREADRWFVSLTVEIEHPDPKPVEGPVVGIDRGLTTFAACSDGCVIQSPKALARSLTKLRRLNKSLHRKKKGSKNRAKAKLKLARQHRKIKNQRKDALHKATTTLARTKSVIVVEDLNVSGMIQNRHLSRAISDMGWGEFQRQLSYKSAWYGSQLVVAHRFFPSTKTCSNCGVIADEVPLSKRTFVCGSCELWIDRDLNAAINLERYVAVSSTETAKTPVLEESSGPDGDVLVKLASMEEGSDQVGDDLMKRSSGKQEPDGKPRERFA